MRKVIIIMAVLLIGFVLVCSLVLHLSLAAGPHFQHETLWQAPLDGDAPETLKAIDLTGDGADEVFVQTPGVIAVFTAAGEELYRQSVFGVKTTMGDFNGDGVDEVAVAEPTGDGLRITAWTVQGTSLWETAVPGVGLSARGQSLDFEGDGRREVVFGTEDGVIIVLDGATGSIRWQYTFAADSPENLLVRGADDALVGGRTYLAAAAYGGPVLLLDGNGQPVWELRFPQQVRRLRAADMDGDGTSEILLGGLNGLVRLVSAADGSTLWEANIGSRVNEARFLELDGNPAQLELAVGSKAGGVFVYDRAGNTLWQRNVSGKIREFATLDADGDGRNELLIAADGLFLHEGDSGEQLTPFPVSQPSTLDVGDFGKEGAFLIGSAQGVEAVQVGIRASSWWATPLIPGFIVAVLIAVAAIVLSRSKWVTTRTTYTVQDMSLEALRARKKMLREVLEETGRMKDAGELTPDVYLARSRQLREELALVEAQILEIQPDYKPDVIQCPSCGAPLEIGLDRCPYCGHVLL